MKERVAALRAEPEPEDLGLSVVVDPEESAGRAFSPVEVGRTLQLTLDCVAIHLKLHCH